MKKTHMKKWSRWNGEWPAVQTVSDGLLHSCCSEPACAQAGAPSSPRCFPHALGSSSLSRTLGGLVAGRYGPCLRNWQSASFLLYPSNTNYSKKINSRLKPSSWMCFLFGKAQFSVENRPWSKQLLPSPSFFFFFFYPKIKCSDEAQQPSDPFPAKWWQTNKEIMINHPEPFITNKQDRLRAIPMVPIYLQHLTGSK